MKHFEIGRWADYVRGITGTAERSEMEAHLASGCGKCRATADWLRKFARVTAAASRAEAPDYAVRCAKAIYGLQQPERVQILTRILARMVYDSFREPLPAGVRTQQRLSRHVLYEAGDYRLDLRLERESGSTQVSLVGQIENRKDPAQRTGNVPVLLAAGKEIVGQTVSNHFGEFHLRYQPRAHLRLYAPVIRGNGKRIEVSLKGLLAEKCEGAAKTRRTASRKKSKKKSFR